MKKILVTILILMFSSVCFADTVVTVAVDGQTAMELSFTQDQANMIVEAFSQDYQDTVTVLDENLESSIIPNPQSQMSFAIQKILKWINGVTVTYQNAKMSKEYIELNGVENVLPVE